MRGDELMGVEGLRRAELGGAALIAEQKTGRCQGVSSFNTGQKSTYPIHLRTLATQIVTHTPPRTHAGNGEFKNQETDQEIQYILFLK